MNRRIVGLAIFFLSFSFLYSNTSYFGSILNHATQSLAATQGSGFAFILFAFFAGILTSLLPCIYPMIPITIGILQGQGAKTVGRNFWLAFSYVNGMALVYAFLGYLSAKFAVLFGSWLASPFFIVAMVVFFVYLAGSMFGFYEPYIPQFLQSPATRVDGGSISHSFVLGMLAATVASPCLAPPLAILIGLVAKAASPALGFVALYAFSLGMGMLLLVVGTFSGVLSLLPRAGGWLDSFKQGVGFIMLGVCVYFLQPLTGVRIAQGLYASVLLAALWRFCYLGYTALVLQHKNSMARAVFICTVIFTILIGIYFKTVFLGTVALVSMR